MDYCTLYTDGSGGHDWYPPHGKSPHKFHTLAGMILKPEQDLEAKKKVDEILDKYIPTYAREIRPDGEYELHYEAIASSKGIYRKIPRATREELIEKVFELIIKIKPILIASSVDKVKEFNKWNSPFPPQSYAMRSVIQKFSMYLNRHEKIGSVVYDEDKIQFNELLQKAILDFRKNGIQIGNTYQPKPDYLPRILNNVNFCPSHLSSGIQLVDFIASAIWRKYERGDNKWYDKLDPLWEYDLTKNKTYKDHIIT